MEDLHAQRRALRGWANHYAIIGDRTQAKAFEDLHTEFESKLNRALNRARGSSGYGTLQQFAADGSAAAL